MTLPKFEEKSVKWHKMIHLKTQKQRSGEKRVVGRKNGEL